MSILMGERRPSLGVQRVNASGVPIGDTLSQVTRASGRLDWSQQATIRRSGDLTRALVDGASDAPIIKLWYQLEDPDGSVERWPLGVYHSASPVTDYGSTSPMSRVELYDGLLFPHQDAIDRPLSVPKGANAVEVARQQLRACGIPAVLIAFTPSDKTLRSAITFDVGTTRLSVINTLLDAADYFGLHCDPNGVYTAKPYVRPKDRPIAHIFRADVNAIFSADVVVDDDTYSVPNKVIATTQLDGAEEMLYAVASINDESSPFHVSKLGRWRVDVLSNVQLALEAELAPHGATEAAKDAARLARKREAQRQLQARADRRLADMGSIGRTITVKHAWVPLDINDAVWFDHAGVTGLFVVTNQSIPVDPLELVTTTLKEAFSSELE